jgi:glucose/arabinose dehydrogenase
MLEDRTVPSALSVSDVTVREGATLGVLDSAGATALALNFPRSITFDNIPASAHYHDLFVTGDSANGTGGEVLRFDWTSQTYQSFVPLGGGGLQSTAGITFGPDGNLYVSSAVQNSIVEYDGTTGNFLRVFVPAGAGGLNWAGGIKFGSDGDLYVCSRDSNQILKYEGPTSPDGLQPGQFLRVFANTQHTSPIFFNFGPDGNLYVSCPHRERGFTGLVPRSVLWAFQSTSRSIH